MIMPVYTATHNSSLESLLLQRAESSKDVASLSSALITSNQMNKQWDPLTLRGAGLFHLAFGALLTGGAVTRGNAKKSEVDGYYRNMGNGNFNEQYDPYGNGGNNFYGNNQYQNPPNNRQRNMPPPPSDPIDRKTNFKGSDDIIGN
jgi:hypothetical protein